MTTRPSLSACTVLVCGRAPSTSIRVLVLATRSAFLVGIPHSERPAVTRLSALATATMESLSPWKTISGNAAPFVPEPPAIIAIIAVPTSVAAPYAKSGMDPDTGKQFGISDSHDCRHRTTRGKAGDKNPCRINNVVTLNLLDNSRENRRLALARALVACAEPIPQAIPIRLPGLFGVGDQEGVLLGEVVHPGTGRKIGRLLLTAVQHDDQRNRFTAVAGRHKQLVGPDAGRLGMTQLQDLARDLGTPADGGTDCYRVVVHARHGRSARPPRRWGQKCT